MRKYSAYILFLLITILVALLKLNDFGPLASAQQSIHDLLCRVTAGTEQSSRVAIVAIDQKSIDAFGEWPWNHDLIADLAAAVDSGNPSGMLLDFDLTENVAQDSAGYTNVLAGQMSAIDRVVVPYDIAPASFRGTKTSTPDHLFPNSVTVDNPLGLLDESSTLQARKVFLPAERLLATKPSLGFQFVQPDADRVVRRQPLLVCYEGYYYPSVALQSAATTLNIPNNQVKVTEGKDIQLGAARKIPIDKETAVFLRFSKGATFATHSAADVLGDKFNFASLAGKFVIVTPTDRGSVDLFTSYVANETPEYLVKATAIDNILSEQLITVGKDTRMRDLLILFIFGAACAFGLPRLVLRMRLMALSAALLLLAGASYYLFSSQLLLMHNVYFIVQIALFFLAAPVIDSALIAGPSAVATPVKKKTPKATATAGPVPVKEIKSAPTDQENLATGVVSYGSGQIRDHRDLGASIDVDLSTAATDSPLSQSSGKVRRSPEIISSNSSRDFADEKDFNPDDDLLSDSARLAKEMAVSESLQIKSLGRYQIIGTLGKGAMGHVYRGVDPAINRPVALKTIRLDFVNDPEEMAELKERLFREAQAAGKLSHTNIVTIYDVGSEGPLQYIAMEYLEGQTLETLIKKKTQFNYRIISQIIMQICSALEYGHAAGIVHRDIKPANIMVLKDYSVKLMDYGIARVDSHSMTKTGIAMGTPNYISPEQLQGKAIYHRADLFSLGVVMYELLIGRRPFRGENITSLIYAILNHEPERPSQVNPQIPLLFDHIITRSLKKNPNERYQRATEIRTDLADFVEAFAPKR